MSQSLKDQLYEALKRSINSGHLESGLVLLEGNIAEIFGMSRSPVRQTLGRLHDEQLICRFDGRGYLVGATAVEPIRRNLTTADFSALGEDAKIERTDTWRAIADVVEHDVVLSSMKGRFELNELQLARKYSVSRTITHRILLYLQSIGVVEKVKYTSWSIVPLDNDRLHNLYEARRQLEPFMIARATQSMPEQQISHFIEKLEQTAAKYPNVEGATLDELESDLHYRTVSMGGNQEIFNMLRRTHPVLLMSKHLLGSSMALPDKDPFFHDHLKIFDRMRHKEGEQASQALSAHLAGSEAKVQERLSDFRDHGVLDIPDYLR